jgi:SAM-dependent methyltransferase
MWLRRLLKTLCAAEELSADTPAGVPWAHLPDACVLQLHWPPDDELLARLVDHGFAPVVLARHPLDSLVSILQFAQHESRTARWLNGAHGNELPLLGSGPTDDAFRHYAVSPRAQALVGLTAEWWRSPALRNGVRYEDLVDAPVRELTRLVDELELTPRVSIDEAVSANGLDALREQTRNGHFWRGRPGLWRSLLPDELARELAAAHAAALDLGGYTVEPDPELTGDAARATWAELQSIPPGPLDDPTIGFRVQSHAELASAELDELIDRLYRLVLRREPDSAGRLRAAAGLAAGTLSPAALLDELVESPEARRVRQLEDALAFARWARAAGERPRELRAPRDVPETAIAIPWALSRYRGEPDVLDIGSANAEAAYLAALLGLNVRRLLGVDPAPVSGIPGLELLGADARQLPLARHSFDIAFCLATLHHVGRDNRAYGLAAEQDENGAGRTLRELRRVVRPGGRVLVSVPAGRTQDLGLFVQLPAAEWLALFEAAGFFVFEHEVYALGEDGWRATGESTDELRYGERGAAASAVLCAELRPGRLRQATRSTLARARGRVAPK